MQECVPESIWRSPTKEDERLHSHGRLLGLLPSNDKESQPVPLDIVRIHKRP